MTSGGELRMRKTRRQRSDTGERVDELNLSALPDLSQRGMIALLASRLWHDTHVAAVWPGGGARWAHPRGSLRLRVSGPTRGNGAGELAKIS